MPNGSFATCPTCGARLFFQALTATVETHSVLDYKGKRSGKSGWFRIGRTGNSWSYRLARWLRLDRVIDRERDHYEETITDPITGKIVHHSNEPLSKHQGHGSAKHKKP